MIAKRQSNRAGNRRGRSAPPAFPNQPSAYISEGRSQRQHTSDSPRRRCPTCDLMVTVNNNGELRAHRVGSPRQGYWPCKGEDVGTP